MFKRCRGKFISNPCRRDCEDVDREEDEREEHLGEGVGRAEREEEVHAAREVMLGGPRDEARSCGGQSGGRLRQPAREETGLDTDQGGLQFRQKPQSCKLAHENLTKYFLSLTPLTPSCQ